MPTSPYVLFPATKEDALETVVTVTASISSGVKDMIKQNVGYVELEVLVVVTMKGAIFWDVTLFTLVEILHLGGMYCLHLQGEKVNQASSKQSLDGLIIVLL